MVTVSTTPIESVPLNPGGLLTTMLLPLKWVFEHFFLIFFLGVLTTGVIIFVMYYIKREEDKRELEDNLYREYKDTIRSAEKNRDPKLYTKMWSKWNLIWFGLPFIKYSVGRKVYNARQEFVGYYDGQVADMFGNQNFLLWQDKTFFMKNMFILRCPTTLYTEETVKGEHTIKTESLKVDDLIIHNKIDKTWTISMIFYEKKGYYYYPVYQDKLNQTLNLTKSILLMEEQINMGLMTERIIQEAGRNVIGMAKTNTQLVYEQRVPEKVQEINDDN